MITNVDLDVAAAIYPLWAAISSRSASWVFLPAEYSEQYGEGGCQEYQSAEEYAEGRA